MKKNFFALSILIVILSIGVYEEIHFKNALDVVEQYTYSLETYINNNDNANSITCCNDLDKYWDKNNTFMEVVFYNPNIKNVSLDIYEVLGALKIEDLKSALARVYVLRKRVDALRETMCFSVESII